VPIFEETKRDQEIKRERERKLVARLSKRESELETLQLERETEKERVTSPNYA
jgi:hypothetical protein